MSTMNLAMSNMNNIAISVAPTARQVTDDTLAAAARAVKHAAPRFSERPTQCALIEFACPARFGSAFRDPPIVDRSEAAR